MSSEDHWDMKQNTKQTPAGEILLIYRGNLEEDEPKRPCYNQKHAIIHTLDFK